MRGAGRRRGRTTRCRCGLPQARWTASAVPAPAARATVPTRVAPSRNWTVPATVGLTEACRVTERPLTEVVSEVLVGVAAISTTGSLDWDGAYAAGSVGTNSAVKWCVPRSRSFTVVEAVPEASVTVATTVPPSLNWTVPDGGAGGGGHGGGQADRAPGGRGREAGGGDLGGRRCVDRRGLGRRGGAVVARRVGRDEGRGVGVVAGAHSGQGQRGVAAGDGCAAHGGRALDELDRARRRTRRRR